MVPKICIRAFLFKMQITCESQLTFMWYSKKKKSKKYLTATECQKIKKKKALQYGNCIRVGKLNFFESEKIYEIIRILKMKIKVANCKRNEQVVKKTCKNLIYMMFHILFMLLF